MAAPTLDVVGIGNAIVDVLARAEDRLIAEQGLVKGTMALVDSSRAESLYKLMGRSQERSGGSAANTIAGLASLGGSAAFIGKVAADPLGQIFAYDLRSLGVRYETRPLKGGPSTGRCLILVTPDAQRTMNTFLGASVEFEPNDIDRSLIEAAQVTYLEGYLFDRDSAKAAFREAAGIAHRAGRKLALSLSDPFCVDRHRADFRALVREHVDILFANEVEIGSLYETQSFDRAAAQVRGECEIAVLTRSAKGSVVVTNDETVAVPAAPVTQVVDSTGAGDLYASGFLHGLTRGRPLQQCGRLGSLCAAEVIGHFGARPETSLEQLARRERLL
ncbi:MAG: adenosine kinase [Stellaceae bacterium]